MVVIALFGFASINASPLLITDILDGFKQFEESVQQHEASIALEFHTVVNDGFEAFEDNPLEVAAEAQKGVTDVISSVYSRLNPDDVDTLSALLTANAEV